MGKLTFDAARKVGNKEAEVFPEVRTLRFAKIDSLVGNLAGGLVAVGIAKGDRVFLHLPNSWQ